MLMLSAGHQQENVREGCTFAFTRIKPMTKDYVSSGSNCMKKHRIVILGAVHEITGRKSVVIGEKTKSKNLKKGDGSLPPSLNKVSCFLTK